MSARVPATLEFVREVLSLGAMFPEDTGNAWEQICWRVDGEFAPATFFVNCNDFFGPGSDGEEITPENVGMLREAIGDIREVQGFPRGELPRDVVMDFYKEFDKWYEAGRLGALLFCARVRGRRPWERKIERLSAPVKALFDACEPAKAEATNT